MKMEILFGNIEDVRTFTVAFFDSLEAAVQKNGYEVKFLIISRDLQFLTFGFTNDYFPVLFSLTFA